jgi:lipopolysaccharide/colanic/teichoic acid biosynthesis glycosyltransferase
VRVRAASIDRVAAAVLAPVLAPLILVLGRLVRRDDGGPGFIALDRMGRHGATFRLWKLRSMHAAGTDGTAGGALITASDDDRISPIGAVLRRHRLDELPQVWNVLRGDMALFGPRPESPPLVDLADERWQEVLAVRPGVTGPTQLVVERWEADVLASGSQEDRYRQEILPVKLAIDAWYVREASLRVDLEVAWSMVQRFVLHRDGTTIEQRVRALVPEAAIVPDGASRG